jgi:undecaprenyl-diphosphatase
LGVAQAAALVPGISRGGAALAAARLREFTRRDAHRLSRRASAPVIGGATLLKALGARHRGVRQSGPAPLAAGACAAFASGLVSGRALDPDGPLWPYVAYRVALAALIVGRLGRLTSGR